MDTSAYCGNCKHREVEHKFAFWPCINCWNGSGRIPATNADRIRSMSDEELAEYLFIKTCEDGFPQFTTKNDWLDWLRREAGR